MNEDERVRGPMPPAHLREEAESDAQAQAAREQSIERTQDEIDAAAIEPEPLEPEDALDVRSQQRLFEQPARRAPRA
jgi:hypothetical protein